MKNYDKYRVGYFNPPMAEMEWPKKNHIEKAPRWCSVDLRDGNQALIVPMSLEEKLEFFQFLVFIGFKEIEVGFPAASETEYEFLRRLIEDDMIPDDVTVQVLTQSRKHIIDKTFESLKGAKRAVVHLYNSTSFAQRQQVFRASEEEIIQIALEMRRRVKEQLKKLGGMEFYDVNFSYIDLEDMSEHYVSVPEQGGGKLIPDGMCNPGQIYTVSRGKSGMIGVFRLESQMLPGNGKIERTGLGSDSKCKEAVNTAFNYLKANGNRISGSISTSTKDYIINYQDLQGIGMTEKLALPTLIALCSIALGKPVVNNLAILGDITISGTMIKVDELANTLQVCMDSGAKKVLIPSTSFVDFASVPADLMSAFQLIPYQSAEDAVFKALGVE